ncbi:Uncharacterised protein [Mycobacteroides abscessus subsp. abscessus]|nr:Uncharacterised protein [Mycobacteroides abscessus subsp. abscessus]
MLPNAVTVWLTPPRLTAPSKKRGAWIRYGKMTAACVTVKFQPWNFR